MEALQTCHTIDSINHLGGSGWCDREETSVEPIFRWCDCTYIQYQCTTHILYSDICDVMRVFVCSFQNNRILNWLYACFTFIYNKCIQAKATHTHLTHWINTIKIYSGVKEKNNNVETVSCYCISFCRTYCLYMFSRAVSGCESILFHIKYNTRRRVYVFYTVFGKQLYKAVIQKTLFDGSGWYVRVSVCVWVSRCFFLCSLNIWKRTSRSLHITLFMSSFAHTHTHTSNCVSTLAL